MEDIHITSNKEIIILIGNYGSGKTELAINFALQGASQGKKTALADIDIVNPYFRSNNQRALLESQGIRVIASPYAGTGIDLPIVSAEVDALFTGDYECAVIDVGGDPVGAAALGRYCHKLKNIQYKAFLVVNVRRPMCSTVEQICGMLKGIESRSRLTVTGLINNTNLANETTAKDLVEGQAIVESAAADLGLPVAYISGRAEILNEFERISPEANGKRFPIVPYMRPSWLDFA